MQSGASLIPTAPAEAIAGYCVVRRLGESSYLCLAQGGRTVVVKPLDEDCIVSGKLHPSIRDRLARVRELAHGGVANLYGVEKDEAGKAWLVWEYVDGQTLSQYIATQPTSRELGVVIREMLLAVESLHGRGIVHGAIHERNVIVEHSRQVRLTHVSPLLYTEPSEDEADVLALLERLAVAPYEGLATVARTARGVDGVLRAARGKLAPMIEVRETTTSGGAPQGPPACNAVAERSSRRWPLVAAGAVAMIGIGLTYGIAKTLSHQDDQPAVTARPIAR